MMGGLKGKLEQLRAEFEKLPANRTPDCPSDEDLYVICFEEEDGPLRKQYTSHILFCPYCVKFIKRVLDIAAQEKDFEDITDKIFPKFEDIDFENVSSLKLYKDHEFIAENKLVKDSKEAEYEIDEPGFYHLTNEAEQVIWRREISKEDMVLSEEEIQQAQEHGLAADTEDSLPAILGFMEKHWDDKLKVELVKHRTRATLHIKINK
jgi:glutaredoxin